MNPAPVTALPCPLCGAHRSRKLYKVKGFFLVRCRGCGLVYVSPRSNDDDLLRLYQTGYFTGGGPAGYENYQAGERLRRLSFTRWYRDIVPHLAGPPGRALDVGCAAGDFLEILRAQGWAAKGIELDPVMRAVAQARGFMVSDSPLSGFVTGQRYGLITLFDVLEHLPYPNQDLTALAGMLAPGGVIAMVTPDFNSLQRRLFGRRWFQFKPREHITYFSRATLTRAAQANGLAVRACVRAGQYADAPFLRDRLRRYGLTLAARLFDGLLGVIGQRGLCWYADTGSLFAVLTRADLSEC